MERLKLISSHDAMIMLRSALSAPKLIYILRASPCSNHPLLEQFDAILRDGLSSIINIIVTDQAWLQASLPIKDGGLGIRSVALLAPSAFLASAASTLELQSSILFHDTVAENVAVADDVAVAETLTIWSDRHDSPPPLELNAKSQSQWDAASIQKTKETLLSHQPDEYNRARLIATSSPHSSDWLFALPISTCGLRLDDETVRVAVGLRLGVPVCEAHTCPCGSLVDCRGSHSLSCKRSAGRIQRHHHVNDVIYKALNRANIPAIKEPSGLSRTDGKRPDGMTLISWRDGRCLTWDVTVIDTLADSYLHHSSLTPGSAAEIAATRKMEKYRDLAQTYEFCPIAFETMGPINIAGSKFISKLGGLLSDVSGDKRETSFLFQRLSIAIQRFNVVCFRGCFCRDV